MIAHNISGSVINGIEASLNTRLFKDFILKANYTWQRPIDKSDTSYYRNNYLPHRPLHEAYTSIKWKSHIFALMYDFNFIGANFRDRANTEFYFVNHRFYHNITFELFPRKDIVATLEIKNILNDLTRDKIGYPLPGRSFFATIAYSL